MEELVVRDGQFYIYSADCVIRVDNTLFRVSDTAYSTCVSHLAFAPRQSFFFDTFHLRTSVTLNR